MIYIAYRDLPKMEGITPIKGFQIFPSNSTMKVIKPGKIPGLPGEPTIYVDVFSFKWKRQAIMLVSYTTFQLQSEHREMIAEQASEFLDNSD